MSNPTTVDRRDVAHPTNPIGDASRIEQQDLAQPLDAEADSLPAAGKASSIRGIPSGNNPNDSADDRFGEQSRDVPPARSGKASAEQDEAEVRDQTSNSGGSNRIDPATRIPAPVKQDLGFRRGFDEEKT